MKVTELVPERFLARDRLIISALVLVACSSPIEDERSWSAPSDQEIAGLLAERMAGNGVGMVVGVVDAEGRRVVAHGISGDSPGRPLDGETVFQIGSLTKPFTSLLLADMVLRGEVGLDDPASDFLPLGVAMPQNGRSITMRDLATHMSGLPSMPSNFDLAGMPDPYAHYAVDDLWTFLSTHTLERAPGTEYGYSNLGVSLLGQLLGMHLEASYETLLTNRVLQPLGMASTSITVSEDQRSRLAPGHGPYLEPVRTWEMETLQASGSLRSTVNDMLNLLEAYLGYRDTPLASAMRFQLNPGATPGDRRALGWGVLEDGTVRHSGGKAGYRSGAAFNPETGVGAVVLANTRTYDSEPMNLAYYLVSGEPLPPATVAPQPKPRAQLSHATLDAIAGRYRLDAGGEIEVVRHGEHLVMRYENLSIWEFAPSNQVDFFLTSGNDDITFQFDLDGRVFGLTRYGDGKEAGQGEYARRLGS